MLTALFYLVGLIIIGGLIFLFFSLTLGRGEQLPAIKKGHTLVNLPASGEITQTDIDNLAFQVNFRGYNMAEVDWVIDQLYARIQQLENGPAPQPSELTVVSLDDQPAPKRTDSPE